MTSPSINQDASNARPLEVKHLLALFTTLIGSAYVGGFFHRTFTWPGREIVGMVVGIVGILCIFVVVRVAAICVIIVVANALLWYESPRRWHAARRRNKRRLRSERSEQ